MPMKMKGNNSGESLMQRKKLSRQSKIAAISIVVSFVLVFALIILSNQFKIIFPGLDLQEFELGKPAARDLIADQSYTYTDKSKTEKLINDQLSVSPPVYEFNTDIMNSVMLRFKDFSEKVLLYHESSESATKVIFKNSLMEYFNYEELEILLKNTNPYVVIPIASDLIEDILNYGVVEKSLINYPENITKIEVWKWTKGRKQFYFLDKSQILMLSNLEKYIDKKLFTLNTDNKVNKAVNLIVKKFVKENIFFDEIETSIKYNNIVRDTIPVTESIFAGDIVIKSGSIVTNTDIERAEILNRKSKNLNITGIVSVFFSSLSSIFFQF